MFDFISREGRFTPEVCRTLFKQLVASIKFLDDRGVTHRDLKP
jgi:serine/threonine protein kinase